MNAVRVLCSVARCISGLGSQSTFSTEPKLIAIVPLVQNTAWEMAGTPLGVLFRTKTP